MKATAKLRHRNTTQARTTNTHTQYATLNGRYQAQLTRGAIIRTGDILTSLGLTLPDGQQSWYGRHVAKAYRTTAGTEARRAWVQHRTTGRWITVYVYSPTDPALTTALYTYKATREALATTQITEAAQTNITATAAVETATCEGCNWECEPVELEPGPSGDPYCWDCLTTLAETRPYAY